MVVLILVKVHLLKVVILTPMKETLKSIQGKRKDLVMLYLKSFVLQVIILVLHLKCLILMLVFLLFVRKTFIQVLKSYFITLCHIFHYFQHIFQSSLFVFYFISSKFVVKPLCYFELLCLFMSRLLFISLSVNVFGFVCYVHQEYMSNFT